MAEIQVKKKYRRIKIEYENELKEYYNEEKLFAPLKSGKINKRSLNFKFHFKELKIEFQDKVLLNLNKNELGYLAVSRIIFNRNLDKGYLSYSFYCGENCYWNNNVEITKVNGKWKITEYFSGGIA